MSQTYVTSRIVESTGTATASTAIGDQGRSPGAPQSMLTTVDFGDTESGGARTIVYDFAWRRKFGDRARPVCVVVGRPDVLGVDDEDALIEGITAIVTNISATDGSFDVIASAPEGTTGLYEVQITGD